ncbi:hypothetical protein [Hydrogenobaculum acidophilum]
MVKNDELKRKLLETAESKNKKINKRLLNEYAFLDAIKDAIVEMLNKGYTITKIRQAINSLLAKEKVYTKEYKVFRISAKTLQKYMNKEELLDKKQKN